MTFKQSALATSMLSAAMIATGGAAIAQVDVITVTATLWLGPTLFTFLDTLPFCTITSILAIVLVIAFFVTSSESGSLVKSTLASGGAVTPPVWQRVFWVVLEGVVAGVLLLPGGWRRCNPPPLPRLCRSLW